MATSKATRTFISMLDEPKNTLGRTEEAVAMVLAEPALIDDLYQCYFQPDEWVRLRVSSSFKRIWRADEELFAPYIDGFVNEISRIDQPSINWTFAKMCHELSDRLSKRQRRTAINRMKHYLDTSDDWIVQNHSIETLASWATEDEVLTDWIRPQLDCFRESKRKSVARKAAKWSEVLALSDQ